MSQQQQTTEKAAQSNSSDTKLPMFVTKLTAPTKSEYCWGISWARSKRWIAIGRNDCKGCVFETKSWTHVVSVEVAQGTVPKTTAVAFGGTNDEILAVAGSDSVALFETDKWTNIANVNVGNTSLNGITFSPDFSGLSATGTN